MYARMPTNVEGERTLETALNQLVIKITVLLPTPQS